MINNEHNRERVTAPMLEVSLFDSLRSNPRRNSIENESLYEKKNPKECEQEERMIDSDKTRTKEKAWDGMSVTKGLAAFRITEI